MKYLVREKTSSFEENIDNYRFGRINDSSVQAIRIFSYLVFRFEKFLFET